MGGQPGRRGAVTEAEFRPGDPLTVLRGVGDKLAATLRRAGLAKVRDLLLSFPRRLAEVTEIDSPDAESLHRLVRIRGRVKGTRLTWLPGRRSMVTVSLAAVADGASFEVRYFNQPYLKNSFRAGGERWAEGTLELRGKTFGLKQGRVLPEDHALTGPCLLSYPEVPGISATRFAGLVDQALRGVDLTTWEHDVLPAGLPAGLRSQAGAELPGFDAAIRAMHQPQSVEEHERARLRFALTEAVALFRRVETVRRRRVASRGPEVVVPERVASRIRERIPFALTRNQDVAWRQILGRLAGPSPMGVLLQGDVGTGKTAVAICAALAVVAAGFQVAFLAPTELLAEQHFAGVSKWLEGSRVSVRLLTSSLRPRQRSALDAQLVDGSVSVVFGTHALFSERTEFGKLGLVIIDEQHRFGVEQRTSLVRKGMNPHVLYMTATPIPRTLTYTVFGDLDLAVLRERPPGHRDVPAFYLASKAAEWRRVQAIAARRIARGQQVIVVCPKIGEDGSKGSAVRMQEELSVRFDCRLVHGRMDAAQRQATIEAFRQGEFGVLVGTTVLEVGIDVPNVTLMVVVGVDRFGLATLHQLRGRVGRGHRRGVCILTGAPGPRVEAICATTDGFELAERDLALRGAGELMGTRQSGLSDLRALDPVRDVDLLQRVRDVVRGECS
jgi:ATP-dependent DNA helicase RecG